MKIYDCRVRMSGSLNHVTPRYAVTAPEIVLLRFLHSQSENANAPVIDIVEVGEVDRRDSVERRRLAEQYSFGELTGDRLISRVFGVPGVALPQALEADQVADVETPEEAEMVLPAVPVSLRVKRGRPSNADLAARAAAEAVETVAAA